MWRIQLCSKVSRTTLRNLFLHRDHNYKGYILDFIQHYYSENVWSETSFLHLPVQLSALLFHNQMKSIIALGLKFMNVLCFKELISKLTELLIVLGFSLRLLLASHLQNSFQFLVSFLYYSSTKVMWPSSGPDNSNSSACVTYNCDAVTVSSCQAACGPCHDSCCCNAVFNDKLVQSLAFKLDRSMLMLTVCLL